MIASLLGAAGGGGFGSGNSSTATSASSSPFYNNAGLTVGGSGRTTASADSGIPSGAAASNTALYIVGGVAVLAIVALLFRK